MGASNFFGGREKPGPSKVSIRSEGFAAFSKFLCSYFSGSTSSVSGVLSLITLKSYRASILVPPL